MDFGLDGLIFPIIVCAGFVFVFGMIVVRAVQGARQWKRNNDSPRLTVEATVVAKRTDVSHNHSADANNMVHTNSTTEYYVTFQFASGDRAEFCVRGEEYGMLAEQDAGKLTFQGTRYLGFVRGEG